MPHVRRARLRARVRLTADFALIKGRAADISATCVYNKTARNFSPLMAMAGATTIVQAASVVAAGELDPETIVTPGIFVDRVVTVADPRTSPCSSPRESRTHDPTAIQDAVG